MKLKFIKQIIGQGDGGYYRQVQKIVQIRLLFLKVSSFYS